MAAKQYPLWSFSREGCLLIQHGPDNVEMVADEDAIRDWLAQFYDPQDFPQTVSLVPPDLMGFAEMQAAGERLGMSLDEIEAALEQITSGDDPHEIACTKIVGES